MLVVGVSNNSFVLFGIGCSIGLLLFVVIAALCTRASVRKLVYGKGAYTENVQFLNESVFVTL
jgi:hypothetical protein